MGTAGLTQDLQTIDTQVHTLVAREYMHIEFGLSSNKLFVHSVTCRQYLAIILLLAQADRLWLTVWNFILDVACKIYDWTGRYYCHLTSTHENLETESSTYCNEIFS
jgi:hypothetical protein